MSFLSDLHTAATIFGIVYVFYWVSSNISNRLLGILIIIASLYYLIFYGSNLFYLLIFFGVLFFFRELASIQDIYFQYQSARELDMRAMEEGQRMVMTPFGPRWEK